MEALMPISYLNDFIFCPYSLYLHQVFDNNTEDVYSAAPQQVGKANHAVIDAKETERIPIPKILKGIYVLSQKLGIYGKIDTLYVSEKKLVESKFSISTIYQGYYYQLWAQYFALIEMGFEVNTLSFFSIKDRKTYPVDIPTQKEFLALRAHIKTIARFDFEQTIKTNAAKCSHCIYAALCDKTEMDHVYA
ncbi:MAG: type V CRISPR-associated protein Cas4 [Bacteroidetes bacterium]|nr:type V CRISPR-associated protein Cas4 [Bacteroidota bacterium]